MSIIFSKSPTDQSQNQTGKADRQVYPSSKDVKVPVSTNKLYQRWLEGLKAKFDDPNQDNNIVVRDILAEIYLGEKVDFEAEFSDSNASITRQTLLASFDPRNITLEPEYYSDIDTDKYYARKPFIWLWLQFDRSPLGWNLDLGFKLRRLLAGYIFKSVGKNLRVFPYVEFSFGYNLSIGDNVVLHRNVFLDDRGGINIEDNASISDYAAVFSHSHDIADQSQVKLGSTEIGQGARITYHGTVLSGSRIGADAMLGAHGLATRSIPDHYVAIGSPAKPYKRK
ncbi:acyltransferase [Planctomycetota bacterium]